MNYSFLAGDHLLHVFPSESRERKREEFLPRCYWLVQYLRVLLIYLDYVSFEGLFTCVERVFLSMPSVFPM